VREVRNAGSSGLNRYIPWVPHGKQKEFLECKAREALFGGAGGGGKTVCLLMDALREVDNPYFSGLILRETYAELEEAGGILDLAHQWLAPFVQTKEVRYDSDLKTYYFKGGGRLQFGFCSNAKDARRYQGATYTYIGIDEICNFSHEVYELIIFRLRQSQDAKRSGIALRIRASANPIGPGYAWVNEHFVQSDDPDRVFIPSRLYDNPYIDAQEYEATLRGLSPGMRQRVLEGIWGPIAPQTAIFKREIIDEHRRIDKHCPYRVRTIISIDPALTSHATSDETGIIVLSLCEDNDVYVHGDRSGIYTPKQAVDIVKELCERYKAAEVVYESNAGNEWIRDALALQMPRAILTGRHSSKGKVVRAGPVADMYERGRVHHVDTMKIDEEGQKRRKSVLTKLEDQMCNWDPTNKKRKSPDRMDALVIGVTHLAELSGMMTQTRRIRRMNAGKHGRKTDRDD
jgi:hypothetical protein